MLSLLQVIPSIVDMLMNIDAISGLPDTPSLEEWLIQVFVFMLSLICLYQIITCIRLHNTFLST